MLADVSRALREEERLAWQRLIRVLGHEINNSLTPINSLAERLNTCWDALAAGGRTARGSGARTRRDRIALAKDSTRFLASYTHLAKLPPPRLGSVNVADWVQRAGAARVALGGRSRAEPDVTLHADGDQLDQLLINLIANAVDAASATGGGVRVTWERDGRRSQLDREDDGPGLPDSANLFVPFFTTKPGGTGIGLVLSRQIAEAHWGTLVLANRTDARVRSAAHAAGVGMMRTTSGGESPRTSHRPSIGQSQHRTTTMREMREDCPGCLAPSRDSVEIPGEKRVWRPAQLVKRGRSIFPFAPTCTHSVARQAHRSARHMRHIRFLNYVSTETCNIASDVAQPNATLTLCRDAQPTDSGQVSGSVAKARFAPCLPRRESRSPSARSPPC